jgi:hypothetical protein
LNRSARNQRIENARWAVEQCVKEGGLDGLRERVNQAKDNPGAFWFRLEGRRYLVEKKRDAWQLAGLAREYRQAALQLGDDEDGSEREELLKTALAIYYQAAKEDRSIELQNTVYVGAGAVFADRGDFRKAHELCERVLKSDPGNKYAHRLMNRIDPEWGRQ